MFCAFHNEHILIARVFYIEHKSAAKLQQIFGICKTFSKKISSVLAQAVFLFSKITICDVERGWRGLHIA